jgi:hypothetical protein
MKSIASVLRPLLYKDCSHYPICTNSIYAVVVTPFFFVYTAPFFGIARFVIFEEEGMKVSQTSMFPFFKKKGRFT